MSVSIPLQTLFANTRAGTVYQTTSAGAIEAVSAETTRTAHWVGGKPHALFEPARTNSIRNSTFTGGTAGVLGSGGVLPTNVSIFNFPAASTTVAFGTEDGFNYFEVRLNGTPTSDVAIRFENAGVLTASNAQTWTASIYAKIQSGDLTNIDDATLNIRAFTSVPALHSLYVSTMAPTATRTRFEDTAQILDASGTGTIASITEDVVVGWTSGAIDITLRFYAPQLELGAFATTPILTSGSAALRAADNATCSVDTFPIDQNGGSIEIIGRAYYTTGGSAFPRILQIDDGTNANCIRILMSENDNRMRIETVVGGVIGSSESMLYTSGEVFHALFVFEEDNVFFSLNGSNSVPDTAAPFPTGLLTTLRWAQSVSGGDNTAAVLINRIASHSHEFSTTGADAITA